MQALPLMIMAGTSLMQYSQQRTAGEIAASEADIAAKGEELGAIQREGDRKSRLAEAMASQIASSGSKGIAAFEGSPLTILNEDIKSEERATEKDQFQTKLSAMATRTRGKVGERQIKARALVGLGADLTEAAALAPADMFGKKGKTKE